MSPYESASAYSGESQASSEGVVPPGAIRALTLTRPWVLFLSVVMFISCGLMFIFAMVFMTAGRAIQAPIAFGGLLGALYLVLAVLNLIQAVLLYRYADAIPEVRATGSARSLECALARQLAYWRFLGVMTLVLICVTVVAFLVAGVATMLAL
jgi:hypothetical protein